MTDSEIDKIYRVVHSWGDPERILRTVEELLIDEKTCSAASFLSYYSAMKNYDADIRAAVRAGIEYGRKKWNSEPTTGSSGDDRE